MGYHLSDYCQDIFGMSDEDVARKNTNHTNSLSLNQRRFQLARLILDPDGNLTTMECMRLLEDDTDDNYFMVRYNADTVETVGSVPPHWTITVTPPQGSKNTP